MTAAGSRTRHNEPPRPAGRPARRRLAAAGGAPGGMQIILICAATVECVQTLEPRRTPARFFMRCDPRGSAGGHGYYYRL